MAMSATRPMMTVAALLTQVSMRPKRAIAGVGDAVGGIGLGEIGDDDLGLAAGGDDRSADLFELVAAARGDDHLRARRPGHLGRRPADAARRAGDDDDLLRQGLEADGGHGDCSSG